MEFNIRYGEVLSEWGLYEGKVGTGSTARTNIAPAYSAPAEQVLVAFAYTVPSSTSRPTFVLSGTPADAIREQVAWMVNTLEERLKELGVSWNLTTEFIAYTPHDIELSLRAEVVPKIGTAVLNGIRWLPGHAPVGGGSIEMGTYGVLQEFLVAVE